MTGSGVFTREAVASELFLAASTVHPLDPFLPGSAPHDLSGDEALAFYALTRPLRAPPPALEASFRSIAATLEVHRVLRTRLAAVEQRLIRLDTDAAAGFERLTGHRLRDP